MKLFELAGNSVGKSTIDETLFARTRGLNSRYGIGSSLMESLRINGF